MRKLWALLLSVDSCRCNCYGCKHNDHCLSAWCVGRGA